MTPSEATHNLYLVLGLLTAMFVVFALVCAILRNWEKK